MWDTCSTSSGPESILWGMETQRAQKNLSLGRGCESLGGRRKGTSKRDRETWSSIGGQMQGQRTMALRKLRQGNFLAVLAVQDSVLPLQGARVRSLVGELRSHIPRSQKKKKK